ncbi:TrbC/VirB2 family protein [Variovorax sp. J22P168]|uniref:TrbC/VirB2 family protein n=1 Tax=Variovorax jilinensis TaxID=3053513 RepID=UPI002574C561|nr:TrbC/VirB2 family protein [Variovorax sp. J22P168]MDM0015053.1 TrbC/VirB2 family protein [Variovorax sp. J22P168]
MNHTVAPRSSSDEATIFARNLSRAACILLPILTLLPELAHAQTSGGAMFGGLTEILKSIVNLVIFEWGYYIGIITLAVQGYRWKTGRIDLMTLGGWGFGIALVFFAPSIVGELRSKAGGQV